MSLHSPTSHPSPFSPSMGLVFSLLKRYSQISLDLVSPACWWAAWRPSLGKVIFICLKWETVLWHPDNMPKPFHASFRDFRDEINLIIILYSFPSIPFSQWVPIASMSSKRGGVGVGSVGGRLYASGGYDGQANLNTLERYYPEEDRWVQPKSKHVDSSHYEEKGNFFPHHHTSTWWYYSAMITIVREFELLHVQCEF